MPPQDAAPATISYCCVLLGTGLAFVASAALYVLFHWNMVTFVPGSWPGSLVSRLPIVSAIAFASFWFVLAGPTPSDDPDLS